MLKGGIEMFLSKRKKQVDENQEERERKLTEFKKLEEESKKSDEEKYGPARLIKEEEFQKIIPLVGSCQAEAIAIFSDLAQGGFLDYKREVADFPSGEKAIQFLLDAMNNKFRVAFQDGRYASGRYVECRENGGKKLLHFHGTAGNPIHIRTTFDLYIREA